MMNKKGFFFMMHPALTFFIGIILGALIAYILVVKGIIPGDLLPF